MPSRIPRRALFRASLGAGALAAATHVHLRSPRLVAAAPGTPSPSALDAQQGALISATPLAELSAKQLSAALEPSGLDTSRVRFGVAAFRIEYQTVDPVGQPTTASALVVLPRSDEQELRTVAWLHGTTVYRGEVASVNEESPDRAITFAFAAAGYAVVAPDYVGLGLGPGYHPYHDPRSEVTASVDALRAGRTLGADEGYTLDGSVLASGFSQGGPAAMALGRALQEGADPTFSLGTVAAIGGPFDMSGTLALALSNDIALATAYLAYLVVAWNRLHHLYDAPGDAFQAPYDTTVESLIDGDHTGEQILAGLPGTPTELFTPTFLDLLRRPTGALRRALDEADSTCSWLPRVPVAIYTASGDRDVPIANAVYCQGVLQEQGADVPLIDLGEIDHGASVVASVPRVLAVFEEAGGGRRRPGAIRTRSPLPLEAESLKLHL